MKTKITIGLFALAIGFSGTVAAYWDAGTPASSGDLKNWVTGSNTWNTQAGVDAYIEDENAPHLGWQGWDTEAAFLKLDYTTKSVHFAVVTGTSPALSATGCSNSFPQCGIAGDILFINPDSTTISGDPFFGLVVRPEDRNGNSTRTVGEVFNNNSAVWDFDDRKPNNPGSWWYETEWWDKELMSDLDPSTYDYLDNQHPTFMDDVEPGVDENMGLAQNFGYTEAKYNGGDFAPPDPYGNNPGSVPHYVIGGTLTFGQLGIASNSTDVFLAMHYTARCANDWITVTHSSPSGGSGAGVPEPGSLALMALGLVGLGFGRHKLQKPT